MVFQGSSRSIGADILIADMVSIAVTREMAPLVVAVAIAARSGSAFAAEIGMMKVNQEIDALTVMNLDVISLIILPRVFAIALAEPILTMIADAVGIIGGLLTAKVHLGVPALMFLNEVRGILKAPDLFTGLLKAVTSGAITGFIGCASGLKAGTESRSVGSQTTAAVVKSIFAVILIDTLYSYIFLVYEW
jgi:phospholipid/cholesterol/gamma-HCH transport system permease protein